MKRTLLLNTLAVLLILLSCGSAKLTSEITIEKIGNPPGTKKIAENIYLDETNIRNLDYLEYVSWLKRIYGKASAEYKSALPDKNVWKKLNAGYAAIDSSYFRNPEYKNFPVIGVSVEQAKKYATWRSDRVMYYTLVKFGIVKMRPEVKDSTFTIGKYFAGQYYSIKPSPYFPYYPVYSLLDSTANTRTGFSNICTYKKWK